jgi:predicted Co/Zn/Cd cation transporter (cation efflux family)
MTGPDPGPPAAAGDADRAGGGCADGCCDPGPPSERATVLVRRVRLLVATTIGYNLLEAAVALTAGALASSTALIGFGLDSLIEVSSAAAVAWQFSGADPRRRERAALRVIALSFFALAGYVGVESVRALAGAGEAAPSRIGILLAAVSLLVMPLLSRAQRRAGRELGSRSAVADSKQTLLCGYLSGVLLVGLLLNELVVGGSGGGAGHRRGGGQGGARSVARPSMLLIG